MLGFKCRNRLQKYNDVNKVDVLTVEGDFFIKTFYNGICTVHLSLTKADKKPKKSTGRYTGEITHGSLSKVNGLRLINKCNAFSEWNML